MELISLYLNDDDVVSFVVLRALRACAPKFARPRAVVTKERYCI